VNIVQRQKLSDTPSFESTGHRRERRILKVHETEPTPVTERQTPNFERCRESAGRVAPDSLARYKQSPKGAARDSQTRPSGNRRAWIQAEPGGAIFSQSSFDTHRSAVFAANDLIAMGALLALHEAGIEVPREVSVVGFDNMPEGRFFYPPLTTATSDFGVMARESLEILFVRIRRVPGADLRRLFRPEMMIRESTAPPRKKKS